MHDKIERKAWVRDYMFMHVAIIEIEGGTCYTAIDLD